MPDTTDQFRTGGGVCDVRYARENLPYGPTPHALRCHDVGKLDTLVVYLAEYLLAVWTPVPGFCIIFTSHFSFYRGIKALPQMHREWASRRSNGGMSLDGNYKRPMMAYPTDRLAID